MRAGQASRCQVAIIRVDFAPDASKEDQLLLCDAQTSGGLLASVPENAAQELVPALSKAALAAAVMGRIIDDGGKTRIHVRNRSAK